ncbi:MAG: hypothetical protein DMG19_13875, partial [Acidobacteria bacterium]
QQGQGDNRNPQGGVPGGPVYNSGDATGPGSYDPRQWQREFQERLKEIREIQNGLGRNDPIARELEQVVGALQGLARDSKAVGNPQAIEKLAQQILDPLRGIELELSRSLQLLLAKENIRSAQEDEIPQGYQKLVEEYYKKLSNPNSKQ